jgi:hypothetical protein
VYKHVFAAIFGRDETKTFSRVEPFYGAIGHIRSLHINSLPAVCGNPASSVLIDRLNAEERETVVEVEKR